MSASKERAGLEAIQGKLLLVRLAASTIATLAMALFVHIYSLMQANLLQYGHKVDMGHLPAPTAFYLHYSLLGYALPLVLASIPLLTKGEKQVIAIETSRSGVVLGALLWLLGCVLAWQLPYNYPVAAIR